MIRLARWYRLRTAKRAFSKRMHDLSDKGLYVSPEGKLSLTKVDGKFSVYPVGGIHDLEPNEVLIATV